MHKNTKNLLGFRFGYLEVIRYDGINRHGCAMWVCRCDCDKEVTRRGSSLTNKDRPNDKHCGCRNDIWVTHGMSKTRPYKCWRSMKERCLNPKHKSYDRYGGRGITVCERWVDSFDNFWADMKASYKRGMSIERINNNEPYSPENCKWATPLDQANNRSSNFLITVPEGTMTIAQAARIYNLHRMTLHHRITHGWSVEAALNTPVKN